MGLSKQQWPRLSLMSLEFHLYLRSGLRGRHANRCGTGRAWPHGSAESASLPGGNRGGIVPRWPMFEGARAQMNRDQRARTSSRGMIRLILPTSGSAAADVGQGDVRAEAGRDGERQDSLGGTNLDSARTGTRQA
jgi:hypothetical protein